MRQLQFFTQAEVAKMRDRTASRNHSPAGDEFRRVHERHRAWGLAQRHRERLRRSSTTAAVPPPTSARDHHRQAGVPPAAVKTATSRPRPTAPPSAPAASRPAGPATPRLSAPIRARTSAEHATPKPSRSAATPAWTPAEQATPKSAQSRSYTGADVRQPSTFTPSKYAPKPDPQQRHRQVAHPRQGRAAPPRRHRTPTAHHTAPRRHRTPTAHHTAPRRHRTPTAHRTAPRRHRTPTAHRTASPSAA